MSPVKVVSGNPKLYSLKLLLCSSLNRFGMVVIYDKLTLHRHCHEHWWNIEINWTNVLGSDKWNGTKQTIRGFSLLLSFALQIRGITSRFTCCFMVLTHNIGTLIRNISFFIWIFPLANLNAYEHLLKSICPVKVVSGNPKLYSQKLLLCSSLNRFGMVLIYDRLTLHGHCHEHW